jgi:hypothetical protein
MKDVMTTYDEAPVEAMAGASSSVLTAAIRSSALSGRDGYAIGVFCEWLAFRTAADPIVGALKRWARQPNEGELP